MPLTLIRFYSKTKIHQGDPRLIVPIQEKPSPFHSPPSYTLTRAKNKENPESKNNKKSVSEILTEGLEGKGCPELSRVREKRKRDD